jgi:Domain of unknown function (DUF5618)
LKNQINKLKISRLVLKQSEEILKRAGKYKLCFADRKYVKLAGITAWKAILGALNITFDLKINAEPLNFKEYQKLIQSVDEIQIKVFNSTYDTLYKALALDGNLKVLIAEEGFKDAINMLEWCEKICNSNSILPPEQ